MVVCLLAVLCVAAPATAAVVEGNNSGAGPEGPRPSEAQELLVGIIVDGREIAIIDVRFDGREFLLPLEQFLAFCECDLSQERTGRQIVTPIGTVLLLDADTVQVDEVVFIRERTLVDKLAIRVLYDRARFALVLDIPWYGRRAGNIDTSGKTLTPDIRAPRTTVSSAVTRLRHSAQPGLDASSANVTMFGRAAGGLWRVRYDDDFAASRSISEYGWLKRLGDDKMFMVGHQQVGLHPLLSTLEVTGAQAAWTNQPLELFQSSLRPTELLPRQLRSRTTISGVGLPAGTAVLRMNDQTIAAQTIGLDGIYEFLDVPLASSQTNRIEVLIYDRYNLATPVDIHDHSRTASDYMLPAGAFVTQGGFGRSGNVLSRDTESGAAGFFQARYGVSSKLTLEGVAQSASGRQEIALGGVLQANPWTVVSLAGARANGRSGYQLDASYEQGGWRALARSRLREAGFFGFGSAEDREHFVEVVRRSSSGAFEVGLIGRYRSAKVPVRFVLPTVSWRPSYRLFVRARPDFDGHYRFDGSWQPDRRWRVGVSRAREVTRLDVSRTLSRSLRASALGEIHDEGGSRVAGLIAWFGSGRFAPSLSGGPLVTNGRPGWILQAQAQPIPGVLLGARYETHSVLDRPDAALDHRVTLSLTSSLSFSGGILPGGMVGAAPALGGIAGRLVASDGYEIAADALERVPIRIDGLTSVMTRPGGFFRLSNLPAGVYRVRLDPDRLPIELTPRQQSLLVEVVAGAVTRVDFVFDVAFGFAGRVRVDGLPLADALVEVLDDEQQVVTTVRTDRFGLYRVDGVPIGSYTVRLAAANAPGLEIDWPSRRVQIVDDFVFDQDLELTFTLDDASLAAAVREAMGVGAPTKRVGQD